MLKALIADDHELVREALRLRLSTLDVEVLDEAENGEDIIALAARHEDCDFILMDVSMPLLNGIEATRQIKANNPQQKVLILSTYDSQDYVRAVAAVGAEGYLLKSADLDEMKKAITIVSMGGTYFSAPIRQKLFGARDMDDSKHAALTSREKEVLQLMDQGMRTKEIGARLNISARTVEVHRRNLKRKLENSDA